MFRRLALTAAVALATFTAASLPAAPAVAAEEGVSLLDGNFSFRGMFGTYDRASLQRGLQIYKEVCSTCHGLYELSYRNLAALGYSEDDVKSFAAQFEVTDGPNDEGQMFQRPARPSDKFIRPFPNEKAARAANGGALPPDLGLIVKARKGGADYVYSLLQGFRAPPPDVKIPDGRYYNEYFPGHQIAMPPPLQDGSVTYADGTAATLRQEAKDIATFLAWAAEPEMEARKQLGARVLLFLLVLTGMLYAAKRKIWADVH